MLPENWPATLLFLDCGDQWEITPSGRFMGLRTEAVKAEIELGGHDITTDDWKRFKRLTRYASKELNQTNEQ